MRISFLGDTMCEPLLLKASEVSDGTYDFSTTFAALTPALANSDYVVCNLETPLAGPEAGYTNSLFSFNAPDEFAKALKDAGVNLVLTANNHCLDRDVAGALRTASVLDEIGIARAGSYLENESDDFTVVDIDGVRIAFVAATYGSNYSKNKVLIPDDAQIRISYLGDPKTSIGAKPPTKKDGIAKKALLKLIPHEHRIALKRKLGLTYYRSYKDDYFEQDTVIPYLTKTTEAIQDARQQADIVIFCPHMGGQFNREPGAFSKLVMELAKEYGCDAVISSHPHVVQKASAKDGLPVFYSLGNLAMSPSSVYILPQNRPEYGIVAHLDLDKSGIDSASYSIVKSCESPNGKLTIQPVTELYKSAEQTERERLLADVLEITSVVGSDSVVDSIQSEYPIAKFNPKVSIVIAAYNAESSIENALHSLIAQTWQNTEIIVINDGSTDATGALVRRLSRTDPRIILINQENQGVSAARNHGLKAASGDYIFFCDADDWLEPDAIETLIRVAETTGADVVTADHYVNANGTQSRKRVFSHPFTSSNPQTLATMQELMLRLQPIRAHNSNFDICYGLGGASWHHLIRRSLPIENSLSFDSSLDGLLEDGLFMTRVFEHAGRISYLNRALYHYRSDSESATHGYRPDFANRCIKALEAFMKYGREHRPDEAYFQAICARAVYFVKKLCDVDLMHPANPYSEKERYQRFVDIVSSEPFKTCLKDLDTSAFLSRIERMQAKLLSQKKLRAYWQLRKTKAALDTRKKPPRAVPQSNK